MLRNGLQHSRRRCGPLRQDGGKDRACGIVRHVFMRRRIVIWVSVIVGLWAVLALGLYLAQDGIVFPGAGRGGSRTT